MKKLLAMIGFTAGLLGLAGTAMALNPAAFTLRVTPGGFNRAVAVSTSAASVDFGTLNLATSVNVVTAASTTVTNAGNIVSNYRVRIDTITVGATSWIAGAAQAADTYNLRALFNGNAAVAGNFLANDDLLAAPTAAAGTLSSASVFSNGVETGLGVVPGANRGLWFKLDMPTSSSVTGQQNIYVEILAE